MVASAYMYVHVPQNLRYCNEIEHFLGDLVWVKSIHSITKNMSFMMITRVRKKNRETLFQIKEILLLTCIHNTNLHAQSKTYHCQTKLRISSCFPKSQKNFEATCFVQPA